MLSVSSASVKRFFLQFSRITSFADNIRKSVTIIRKYVIPFQRLSATFAPKLTQKTIIMDRRNFLKQASSYALLAAGTMAGVSDVFAGTSSTPGTQTNNVINQSKGGNMEQRNLGGLNVSAIGLGCLPMVGYYGGKYEKKDMVALIRRAYDKGVTFFDTAEVYGPHTSEEWVDEAVSPIPRPNKDRHEVRLRRGRGTAYGIEQPPRPHRW